MQVTTHVYCGVKMSLLYFCDCVPWCSKTRHKEFAVQHLVSLLQIPHRGFLRPGGGGTCHRGLPQKSSGSLNSIEFPKKRRISFDLCWCVSRGRVRARKESESCQREYGMNDRDTFPGRWEDGAGSPQGWYVLWAGWKIRLNANISRFCWCDDRW